ncbi:hypothetical protein QNN03_18785 [Streptomyces sp. GXMU-J15]|uniref:Uncharacterized protein n=1 Tax=Streptomyces fuscus TaxID=3048495 RepID=A0ABT7J119_9ACTN|nr:hypothetical protein [Streptomyces fuscus]MDL2078485.1 hypothetical protein [Streptomyces fuscus]
MFQDSPIYDRLISERGDVPSQVRREAERVSRELEFVMQPLESFSPLPAERPAQPGTAWQRSALPPGPQR